MQGSNPFIFEAATNLSSQTIEELYIDVEKSDLLVSQKNIFLEGYRGSGKSMLLKHNSFETKHKRDNLHDFIGVYISCQTPIFFKREYELLHEKFSSSIISEHLLVLSMAHSLINSIHKITFLTKEEEDIFIKKIEFYFNLKNCNLESFEDYLENKMFQIQQQMNKNPTEFYTDAYTYSSLILPIIKALKKIERLSSTHFSFFLDDGQYLSSSQKKIVNSWISFRDTTNISFKIAIASKKEYTFYTNTNSIILENHDYMILDLEKEFFGNNSRFYNFAKKVIEKRLEIYNIPSKNAIDFFPQHETFKKDIDEINKKFIAGEYHEQKDKTKEYRKTNASKYNRAIYFRQRLENSKANHPSIPYTGFETLSNISTGVIRNLLAPCYIMYNRASANHNIPIKQIDPKIQYEVIKEESNKTWENIKNLSSLIEDCDEETANKIYNFLTNFGNKLRSILLDKSSTEKQILTFTIENLDSYAFKDEILKVINIAEKAGLLYSRIGAGKNTNRTVWYTPYRILWTSIGLDPVGQNGRLNITPENFKIMMNTILAPNDFIPQKGLFDDEL